jgi:hypothetical protein
MEKYGEVWRDSLDLSGSINNGSIIRKIFHKKNTTGMPN